MVEVTVPDCTTNEFITNKQENFKYKHDYYAKAYNDNLELISFPTIKIVTWEFFDMHVGNDCVNADKSLEAQKIIQNGLNLERAIFLSKILSDYKGKAWKSKRRDGDPIFNYECKEFIVGVDLGDEVNPWTRSFGINLWDMFDIKEIATAPKHYYHDLNPKLLLDLVYDEDKSDGYHTFKELYHQRAILFATICNAFKEVAWKSKKHHDGTMFGDNWFIVGVQTSKGQYTYHYEVEYWHKFDVKELDFAPEFDGHTDKDVERLLSLVK